MNKNNNKTINPIFISGIPRSGTTLVGNILSSIKNFQVIYEPFHFNQGIKSLKQKYLIPNANIDETEFFNLLKELSDGKSRFKNGIKDNDTISKKILKLTLGNPSSFSYKKYIFSSNKQLVVKDPFLIFSSIYLSQFYKIIITERPLIPLASSLKRMGWIFSEANEVRNDLETIGINIRLFDTDEDISKEVLGCIHFNQIFIKILQEIKENEKIHIFNQNNFIENPKKEIQDLYSFLNVSVDDWITEKVIYKTMNSKSENYKPREKMQHDSYYNKLFSNKYYTEILTKKEIEILKNFNNEFFCSGGEI